MKQLFHELIDHLWEEQYTTYHLLTTRTVQIDFIFDGYPSTSKILRTLGQTDMKTN